MVHCPLPLALTLPAGIERMFPTPTPAQVEQIAAHGPVRPIVEPPGLSVPFIVVTLGQIEIVQPSGTTETLIVVYRSHCCDDSAGRDATKHARASKHPVIASEEPGECWLHCYPDEAFAEY